MLYRDDLTWNQNLQRIREGVVPDNEIVDKLPPDVHKKELKRYKRLDVYQHGDREQMAPQHIHQTLSGDLENTDPEERKNHLFLYHHKGSKVNGALWGEMDPKISKLMKIHHVGSMQNGVGTALMDRAEAHAKKNGLKSIELNAVYDAAPFYEKLGYKDTGDEDWDYPGTTQMRKTL